MKAWGGRAAAWHRLERWELAEDDVNRALALAPGNADALPERGNLHELRGRTALARADWMAALRHDPEGPAGEAAWRNIERMNVRGR